MQHSPAPLGAWPIERSVKRAEEREQRAVQLNLLLLAAQALSGAGKPCFGLAKRSPGSGSPFRVRFFDILSAATKSLGLYITEPTIIHLSDVPINGPNPSIEGHLFPQRQNDCSMLGRISHTSNDESKKSLFPTDDKLLDEPPADGTQLAKFGLTLESVYYSPAGGLNDILAAEGVATFMANRARQQQKEEEAAREGGGVEEKEGDEQNNRHINEGEGRHDLRQLAHIRHEVGPYLHPYRIVNLIPMCSVPNGYADVSLSGRNGGFSFGLKPSDLLEAS
uniref:Uncharacterized protein n=1 Tax=Globodera rostochiensis TaxID=31243 RepID=A0A914I3E5_GLORO